MSAARRAADRTQEWLADAVGVSQSTVARWERGDIALTLPNIRAVAAALNVPVSSLIPDCEGGAAA